MMRRKHFEEGANSMPSNSPPHEGQKVFPPFETLYDRYHMQVYHYLYTHLKNEQDAADLLQHVFLQAWKHAQSYDAGRGSVATWLLSIARHRLIDFYRVSRTSLSWENIPDITSMEQNPEARAISQETIAQVRKMLEALPQTEQELLALRFAARLSSAEIAPLIGKSEAATKKQLTRLLHRLQEQYRRDVLEELLPELLEPALPAFVEALLQTYAAPIESTHLTAVRQNLLKLVYPVSL
jgi:RNA polymerase sigma-70 factor (ECF subfamily)